MASTYSPNLRLELIGTGEQQGTWGSTTNTNLGTLLEEAIGGYVSVAVTDGADTTLTTNNGSADQSRNMTINLTGALTAARNVICPAIEKMYIVKNATTGGFAVTFKVSGQTGVSIPNGSTYILYVNGTDAALATGTIAAQNSNNVSITGGSISGITDLAVADGGTGASDASTARTNLGIGTIATQNANNVSITGGSITGITDLAVADGGTGASDAATARTNLGIGTMGTQNANAVAITGGTIVANASGVSIRDADASNVMTIAVGSNLTANTTLTLTTGATTNRTLDISAANVTVSVAGAALIDDADAAAQRTTLGLGTIATQNANAVSITGGSVTGITDLAVADGGTGASDAATARTNLGLAIGTNVQAYSARLGEIAALAPTLDNFIVGTGTGWSLETPALARTSLGLGTIATQNANAVSITGGSVTGITDITVSDGGTGASSFTAYSVVLGGTTSTAALQTVSGTGTSGQVLTSAGAGAIPAWTTVQGVTATTGSPAYYGARAWLCLNGQGTIAIKASVNISSVTDNGTGDYTVNFTTAMPDENYASCAFSVAYANDDTRSGLVAFQPTGTTTFVPLTKTTSAARIINGRTAGAGMDDPSDLSYSVFR
jgi:hypothetical protein